MNYLEGRVKVECIQQYVSMTEWGIPWTTQSMGSPMYIWAVTRVDEVNKNSVVILE